MSEKTKKQDNPNRETALTIFRGIMNTKSADLAQVIADRLNEGEIDPAYVGILLKKMAKTSEKLFENSAAKELIFNNTKLYKEKTATFNVFGAKIQIANTGYWDFSNTEDPYLEKLKEIQTQVKNLIKDREDELKALAKSWETRTSGDGFNRGLGIGSSFVVTFNNLPKLIWEEAVGEINTDPPIKRGRETLKYFV